MLLIARILNDTADAPPLRKRRPRLFFLSSRCIRIQPHSSTALLACILQSNIPMNPEIIIISKVSKPTIP
uniref:Uncharacterized protein n=1 Tax=Lepeophtheirus salmonis TaxID=72036 RepID=A0A0K2UH14_LEPSM